MDAQSEPIREVLKTARTVAVVGLSENPDRPSHRVAAYLKGQGYRVIPVNPAVSQVLGEKAYAALTDVPEPVDVVDVFRKSEAVPEIVQQAIAARAGALWLQEGVEHPDAEEKARAAGLNVVVNRCMMKEHRRLTLGGGGGGDER